MGNESQVKSKESKKLIGWYKESIDHFLCRNCASKIGRLEMKGYDPVREDDLREDVYTCDECGKIFEKSPQGEKQNVSTDKEGKTKYCSNCGAEIDAKAKICPKCGVEQAPIVEKVSNGWYVLPLLLGIIGGLIAWVVNKDLNPKKAREFMIFGIVWTIVGIAFWWIVIIFLDAV